MGLVREPEDVNLNIQSKSLTPEEEERLSQFIQQRKQETGNRKKETLCPKKLYGSRAEQQ